MGRGVRQRLWLIATGYALELHCLRDLLIFTCLFTVTTMTEDTRAFTGIAVLYKFSLFFSNLLISKFSSRFSVCRSLGFCRPCIVLCDKASLEF